MKKLIQFQAGTGAPMQTIDFADSGVLTTLQVVPELMGIILGHKNAEMVAPSLFTTVPGVQKESGKYPYFGKEAWNLHNATRALRGEVQHPDVLNSSSSYSLDEYSLGFMIDRRELEEFGVTREALMTVRTSMVESMLDVAEEYAAAVLATTSGNYPSARALSGAAYDWAGAGNPVKNILDLQEVIRAACGRYGNTVVFDPTAWKLFRTNSTVRSHAAAYLAAAGGAALGLVTEQLAATILGVDKVAVGKMVMANAAGTVSDIWGTVQTGNVVVAYTGNGMLEPTYGIKIPKLGYPKAESYWDNAHKSEVFDVQRIFQYKVGLPDSTGDFAAGGLLYSVA